MTGQQDLPARPDAMDGGEGANPRTLPTTPERAAQHPGTDYRRHTDSRAVDHIRSASTADQLRERLWRLPPGHPSSPYDANGDLRPPVPDYRQLERPLPGEVGYGEPGQIPRGSRHPRGGEQGDHEQDALADSPGERPIAIDRDPEYAGEVSNAWRQAVTRLEDAWRKHEEEWPETGRPAADHSDDEPGSWRGDSGHYLNTEENLVSGHALERIGDVEKKTTPTLLDIKEEVSGSELVGLQNRLKGEDRFKEKVADEVRAKPERPISLISENMPDAMRYTYQLSSEHYVSGYWEVHSSMVEHGYTLDFRRNTWDSSQYKGLNTRWRSPEGQLFEVQFHTPESFEAKQLTHKAYERIRSPVTSDIERDSLYAFQAEVCSHVPVPRGALTIPDYREG